VLCAESNGFGNLVNMEPVNQASTWVFHPDANSAIRLDGTNYCMQLDTEVSNRIILATCDGDWDQTFYAAVATTGTDLRNYLVLVPNSSTEYCLNDHWQANELNMIEQNGCSNGDDEQFSSDGS
jgi:hypothetical protein